MYRNSKDTALITNASSHRARFFEKPGEQIMTIRSANRPGRVILASVLSMSGFFFAAAALCGAQTKATTFGYVANALDNTISVIATASNAVVATIPVGSFPTGVATTPDGTHPPERDNRRHQSRAYVTNQLESSSVSVIDTSKNTVVATIPVGGDPTGVAVTPDGTHA